MLHCFSFTSGGSSALPTVANQPSALQDEITPRSDLQSPTANLTKLYSLAVESSSYREIQTKIQVVENWEYTEINNDQQQQLLIDEILQPNRGCVEEALRDAKRNVFKDLASAYFNYSEETCHLLLHLLLKVFYARSFYGPISDLVDVLPSDLEFLSQSQCDWAFDIFAQFDSNDNPFPCTGSHSLVGMQRCFSQIKQQVDHHQSKSHSRSRICFGRRSISSSAVCPVGPAVGIATAAVAIAAHALITLVSFSFPVCLPSKLTNREIALMAQLDAASKCVYVLRDLETIDRLVDLLYTAVENDKFRARFVLTRGKDKHPIYEVVKKLRETHVNVVRQLADLEVHICLCFDAINSARSLLLEELHQ
ncbi:hypothetical protein Dimus_022114 [Dionaea muscipula]